MPQCRCYVFALSGIQGSHCCLVRAYRQLQSLLQHLRLVVDGFDHAVCGVHSGREMQVSSTWVERPRCRWAHVASKCSIS